LSRTLSKSMHHPRSDFIHILAPTFRFRQRHEPLQYVCRRSRSLYVCEHFLGGDVPRLEQRG
jgi:hypothetical protein